MSLYGYARFSTNHQDLGLQKAGGCEVIHSEKVTGISREARTGLATLLGVVCPGGTLVVTRVDRLVRSRRPAGRGARA